MSFRAKDSPHRQSSNVTLSELKEGQKIDGIVKRIEEYGLFIQLEGSKLNGLCHKSQVSCKIYLSPAANSNATISPQLSDNAEADVSIALKGFREGDKVKAVVLSVENKRISLSLKPSHFTEEDFVVEDGPEDQANEVDVDMNHGHAESEEENGVEGDESDVMEVNLETQNLFQPTTSSKKPSSTQGPTLAAIGGFRWLDEPLEEKEEDAETSSDEEGDNKPTKKRRKRKEIEHDLTADMHTKTPESNADFERLLLGSPNSSYLWIQYMSFQLPLSEVDKAREIAKRAIKTINFREEQERMNVWIALLNLENVYGTDQSLESIFKEASRANDSKTIHLRLATIFAQSEKPEVYFSPYPSSCSSLTYAIESRRAT